jgi:hypothetical protein
MVNWDDKLDERYLLMRFPHCIRYLLGLHIVPSEQVLINPLFLVVVYNISLECQRPYMASAAIPNAPMTPELPTFNLSLSWFAQPLRNLREADTWRNNVLVEECHLFTYLSSIGLLPVMADCSRG